MAEDRGERLRPAFCGSAQQGVHEPHAVRRRHPAGGPAEEVRGQRRRPAALEGFLDRPPQDGGGRVTAAPQGEHEPRQEIVSARGEPGSQPHQGLDGARQPGRRRCTRGSLKGRAEGLHPRRRRARQPSLPPRPAAVPQPPRTARRREGSGQPGRRLPQLRLRGTGGRRRRRPVEGLPPRHARALGTDENAALAPDGVAGLPPGDGRRSGVGEDDEPWSVTDLRRDEADQLVAEPEVDRPAVSTENGSRTAGGQNCPHRGVERRCLPPHRIPMVADGTRANRRGTITKAGPAQPRRLSGFVRAAAPPSRPGSPPQATERAHAGAPRARLAGGGAGSPRPPGPCP